MRLSLVSVCSVCIFLPTLFYGGVGDFPSDATDKLGRIGAWGSVAALFAGEAVIVKKLVETGFDRMVAKIPGLSQLKGSGVSALIGSACALPVTCVSFARAREMTWYFFFILYSGRRASPQLARDAVLGLSSYIEHLNMLKEIYHELEQLLRTAEQVSDRASINSYDTIDIAKNLIRLLQDAVASGEEYIFRAKTKFEELGIYQLAQLAEQKQSACSLKSDTRDLSVFSMIRSVQEEVSPVQLTIDLTSLDRLVRDLLNYWSAYLGGLVSGIDNQVALCKTVYSIEQFIVTVFKRYLIPVPIPQSNQSNLSKTNVSEGRDGSFNTLFCSKTVD